MQYNLFSQILCKNQFSFFGSCVYKTYFNNSDESITWVPKIIENAFINLNQVWNSRLWFSSWGFNFQLEDSLSNSGLQFFNLRIIWTWWTFLGVAFTKMISCIAVEWIRCSKKKVSFSPAFFNEIKTTIKLKNQKWIWISEIRNENGNEKHGQIIKAMACDVRSDDRTLGLGFCILNLGFWI